MEIKEGKLKGIIEIQPRIFPDNRGRFFEGWNQNRFEEMGLNLNFVQDNHSFSHKGVLRGLHFQNPPHEQGKLVFVPRGKVLDVAVDIRLNSPSYGKYEKFLLDGEKGNMVFIPAGFAHGFLAIEDSNLSYKCTNFYNQGSEAGIFWNDSQIGIDWGISDPMISEKDAILPVFAEFNSLFQ